MAKKLLQCIWVHCPFNSDTHGLGKKTGDEDRFGLYPGKGNSNSSSIKSKGERLGDFDLPTPLTNIKHLVFSKQNAFELVCCISYTILLDVFGPHIAS